MYGFLSWLCVLNMFSLSLNAYFVSVDETKFHLAKVSEGLLHRFMVLICTFSELSLSLWLYERESLSATR